MRFILLSLFFVSSLEHSLAQSVTANSFNAEYKITRGSMTLGTLKRTLLITDDGHYEFVSKISSKGLASLFLKLDSKEVSSGKIIGKKVLSETFSYSRKEKQEKNFSIYFDYDLKTVSNPSGRYAWKADISSLILDKLGYQLQLMLDMENSSKTMHYKIADRKGPKTYLIEKTYSENIYTGIGLVSTTKVKITSKNSKTKTNVWCATELDWLPVKVEHRDKKGNLTVALLTRLQPNFNARGVFRE